MFSMVEAPFFTYFSTQIELRGHDGRICNRELTCFRYYTNAAVCSMQSASFLLCVIGY